MKHSASFLLRIGLAFSFLYAAISAFIDATPWVGFIPPWVGEMIEPTTALYIFGVLEIIVAIWLLWGRKIFWAAGASVALLVCIIVPNLGSFPIIFRDITLLCAALALAQLHK